MTTSIIQKGATAGGDIVGGNKVENHFHLSPVPTGIVGQLLAKLQIEIEKDETVRHTIEALTRFHTKRSHDGVDGLEAKLSAAGGAPSTLLPSKRRRCSSSF